ncbi:autotransporter outer membrane beta-barrel domain-containing protein [Fusobacterium varium]|uniref:autotransporter outer membrane beta-barrel domain-containing protein n=1 Tax=Fusobacterium varium TaxID=856 RepID=UPI002FF06C2D
MIEKIIKAVKSSNKRRGRNITIGAVVGFLLSCTAVMGAEGDNYLWIRGNNKKIEFNTIITTDNDGNIGNWNKENPYSNNNWDKDTKTYTNNMTLLSSKANGRDGNNNNISYGLRLSGNLNDMNFVNNGSITGIISASSGRKGYGIYNLAIMGNMTNKGIISGYGSGDGTGSARGAGFGIYNSVKNNNIGNIENIGIISGYGNAIFSNGTGYGIYNAAPMGNVTNKGIISGYGYGSDEGWGIYNNPGTMSIINTGVISGTSFSAGYGINNSDKMESITNKGIISGSITSFASKCGYGIYNLSGKIGNITNKGVISGTGDGYGIANATITSDVGEIEVITNTGIIYGKDNAIKNESGTITTAYNYGILVNGDDGKGVVDGLTIVDETPEENKIVNKGLIFTALDIGVYKAVNENEYGKFGQTYDESIVIGYQEDGTGKLSNPITKKYTIINAAALGDDENSITGTESLELENGTLTTGDSQTINISSDKGYILNGITNTLKVSEGNNELNDSVINAYKTAVVMDSKDSTLILNNTVANGGADKDVPTIKIEGENNTLTLKGESIVNTGVKDNVAITVGGENNVLVLEGNAKVNGEMTSTGNNTLSLNGNAEDGMNMLHNITGFVNMNIHNNVTFFEDVEVTGTEKVTIAETGTLNLRLKNAGSEETVGGENIPKATHAFSGNENEMIIQGEGNGKDTAGILRFITNGIGKKIYVDMKNIELRNLYFKTSSVIDGYDVKDKEYIILGAYGSLDGIYKPENTGKDGQDSNRYEALNNIYKGIYSSTDDNLNALRVLISSNEKLGNNYDENMSDEEQLKNLLSYLGSIYTETPYSFSSELSRKSMGMFRDIVTENQFRPDLNRWLIMGGLTHRDGGTKDSYYGQNYHGIDTGTADVDVDMKLTGAYALGKYGYSENISLGITAGGNKSEAKLSMSKVKGNSGYIGAFAENYRGNLTLKGGAGIQYSEYDANRATIGGHSYNDKYSDMAYDIYLNGRYSHNIGNNLFLEPYGTLSYTYIKQDNADEGSKVLAIETDSKSFDYTAAKVGVDLKKVIPHEKGKSTLSAGVSYTRLLNGADEENITGRFKGKDATDFDILVAHKNEHSIGLNAKYALELENGVLFDVKGSYNVERDSHNGSGKNRTKGEWIVGVGIGYKF